jgi:hypothetical protein
MKPFREIPYLLRLTALIFVFNGLYAFLHTLLSLLNPSGFFFDPRILNIFIAFGLMAGKKLWYLLGLLSLSLTMLFHLANLVKFASSGAGFVAYFLAGLAINIFQLYVLLGKNVRGGYFPRPGAEV